LAERLETLNSVIENQDADVNFQLAFGDILTRHVLHAFKFMSAENFLARLTLATESLATAFEAIDYR
jgi:hypothetical protein